MAPQGSSVLRQLHNWCAKCWVCSFPLCDGEMPPAPALCWDRPRWRSVRSQCLVRRALFALPSPELCPSLELAELSCCRPSEVAQLGTYGVRNPWVGGTSPFPAAQC